MEVEDLGLMYGKDFPRLSNRPPFIRKAVAIMLFGMLSVMVYGAYKHLLCNDFMHLNHPLGN